LAARNNRAKHPIGI